MHEQIIDALRRGAADEALAAARQAVAEQPTDAAAQRLLASALRMNGDIAGALAVVDQALTLAPEDAGLHMERGSLLMTDRGQLDEAQAALARSLGLDPNQFPAYILQAQLALGRGDLEEAQRLARTASRLAPEHPQVAGIEGMVALYRGEHELALRILTQAAQRAPGDPSLRPALGFAYLANGRLAFAEQTFRSLLERSPDSVSLRTLVADLVRRQGRKAEAADSLAEIVRRPDATPGLRRSYGRLELEAGRPERALPLLSEAFERDPDDIPTLEALIDLWQHGDHADAARQAIDGALAQRPQSHQLWRARLLFEAFAGEGAKAVVERWMAAMPDHIPALEARATIHDHAGETDQADEIAYQIAALQPGRSNAELRIVDILMRRDPKAAVARVEGLIAQAQDPDIRRGMRQLLGRTLAAAGEPVRAVEAWAGLQAELAPTRLPLPPLTADLGELPPYAPAAEGTPGVLFLWGPPGSMVERLGATMSAGGLPLLIDRTGARPPRDPLQRYGTAQELLDGRLDPSFFVSQWRAALPGRGVGPGAVFDWLLWWDNALVRALRANLPEALLMVGIRDPRDMLLDWLAWGPANSPFALESPMAGAQWMAQVMGQLADLHERDLFPHSIVPLDVIQSDPQALVGVVNKALGLQLPPPPRNALGTHRLAPGAWRHFAQPLAQEFALLTPVAVRLGYAQE